MTYSENPYDIERYQQVQQIAAEIMATHTTIESSDVLNLFRQEAGYATPKVDGAGCYILIAIQLGQQILISARNRRQSPG